MLSGMKGEDSVGLGGVVGYCRKGDMHVLFRHVEKE